MTKLIRSGGMTLRTLAAGTMMSAAAGLAAAAPASAAAIQAAPSALSAPSASSAAVQAVLVANYACRSTMGNFVFRVVISGKTPSTVPTGTRVQMTQIYATIVIPANFVDEAIALLDAKTASGQVITLNVAATDSTPKTLNMADPPVAFGPLPLREEKSLSIKAAKGAVVGYYKAAAAGSMTFTSAVINIDIKLNSYSGEINCTPPPSESPIATTTVT